MASLLALETIEIPIDLRSPAAWAGDTRIEVAVAGDHGIESWPEATSFDTRSIFEMIPYRPTSTASVASGITIIGYAGCADGRLIGPVGTLMSGGRSGTAYTFCFLWFPRADQPLPVRNHVDFRAAVRFSDVYQKPLTVRMGTVRKLVILR